MCRFIKGCLQLRLAPPLTWPVDMNPVDIVAGALVAVSLQPANTGRVFHFCHPRPSTLPALFAWLRGYGFEVEVTTYAAWRAALQAACRASSANALYPLLPMFRPREQEMGGADDFPAFSSAASWEAVRQCDEDRLLYPPPAIDDALLASTFDYMVQSGFLEPPTLAQGAGAADGLFSME